jgi:hypothetical protein
MLLLTAIMLVSLAATVAWASTDAPTAADWLEPRGLSVVDLIGLVPDDYLQGTILSFGEGYGITVYESGTRVGDTVVVTATLYSRFSAPPWAPNNMLTSFGCLGQTPHFDHMGTVVPQSTLRVYDSTGADVTSQIQYMFITYMDTKQPSTDSAQPFRYLPVDDYGPGRTYPLPLKAEGLVIPPNSGCQIQIPGADYYPLTGIFTLSLASSPSVSVLGSQEAIFQSYIGVGSVGIFAPLMRQLESTYGSRHGRIPLSIAPGSDYILVKAPTMPGDAYTDKEPPYYNADRPSSGTYRLSKDVVNLSADLTISALFPLKVTWQDADQAPGNLFLPLITEPTELAPPEYVIPTGIAYDNCFTQGDCSPSILQQIYDAEMTLEILYLRVSRPAEGQWVPVKMAGPAWSPSAAADPQITSDSWEPQVPMVDISVLASAQAMTTTHSIFLPIVIRQVEEELPEDCPCGWFDDLGRMLDFAPGP